MKNGSERSNKSVGPKEENVDPWSLCIHAIKAPMTKDRYQTRLANCNTYLVLILYCPISYSAASEKNVPSSICLHLSITP